MTTFTIYLNNAVYATGYTTSETMALLLALGHTGVVTAQLDGPR